MNMNNNVGTHPGASETREEAHPGASIENIKQRKSPRADFHDYSGGDYFVTICTRDKEHYFGEICNGEMCFSEIGKIAHDKLLELASHYSYAQVPLFVVMPNHIHAIICIRKPQDAPGCEAQDAPGCEAQDAPGCEAQDAPGCEAQDAPGCVPTKRTALSVVIGGYKQAVTMFARRNNIEFGWQGRYHDHIIRGSRDGNMIAEYINNNVARWDSDCFKG